MNEIKEQNKWRDTSYSWIGRFNIVKMSVLLNSISMFNAIPMTIPASSYFVYTTNKLKNLYKEAKTQYSQLSIRREQSCWLTLPDFKAYCKSKLIKICGIYERIDIYIVEQNKEPRNRPPTVNTIK